MFERFRALALVLLLGFVSLPAAHAADEAIKDPENTLVMQLKDGRVVIQMRPDLAPHTVLRIKELVRRGYYDGAPFHRVIPKVMAQAGDTSGRGIGGSGFKIMAEFSGEHHVRGTVSMARASDPNSADSQFFICLSDDSRKFDGRYTIWGQVISGMEFVDQIKVGDAFDDGKVVHPDHITWVKVAADLKE